MSDESFIDLTEVAWPSWGMPVGTLIHWTDDVPGEILLETPSGAVINADDIGFSPGVDYWSDL